MRNLIKYSLSFFVVLFFRLIPHPPNTEGIMASVMPLSKKYGPLAGVVFGGFSILVFDLVTGTAGVWSFFTVGCYSIIGLFSGIYFRNRKRWYNYLGFSIAMTLFYDIVTGIGLGVIVFKQSLAMTIMGQIPFTLWHLAGNSLLAVIISPLLYRWVLDNPHLETHAVISRVTS